MAILKIVLKTLTPYLLRQFLPSMVCLNFPFSVSPLIIFSALVIKEINFSFIEVDATNTSLTSPTLRLTSNAVTTEGSQCSSSCSTVVVVSALPNGPPRIQRTSATSSLELGYSHTAQNSAVSSETVNFPGVIYDRCKKVKYAGK